MFSIYVCGISLYAHSEIQQSKRESNLQRNNKKSCKVLISVFEITRNIVKKKCVCNGSEKIFIIIKRI